MTKRGIVVLGMDSSGTSAVAGAFAAAGCYAGAESELMAADDSHPRGYFENLKVVALNRQIMSELRVNRIPPDEETQRHAREAATPLIQEALTRMLDDAGGAPVVLKDPWIGLMLTLWGPPLEGVLHPVLVIRDPVEIALSLGVRDRVLLPLGLAVWEVQFSTLLNNIKGQLVTVAKYSELTTEPDAPGLMVRTALAHLGAEYRKRVTPGLASSVIVSRVRHNPDRYPHEQSLTSHQLKLWAAVAALPSGDTTIDLPSELTTPSRFAVEAARYADEQLPAAAEERRELIELLEALVSESPGS